MSWFIIINPKAGNRNVREEIPKFLSLMDQNNLPYSFVFTKHKDHATSLCIKAIEDGFRKIISVGGDGTNHEIINGIMRQQTVPTDQILFHCLPSGTGNDWIKHHQLPLDWAKSVLKLINPKQTKQDIGKTSFFYHGKATDRYFYNVAGLAYDGFIVRAIEKKQQKKKSNRKSNGLIYLLSIFYYLFKYKLNEVEIQGDGLNCKGSYYTINIGITKYSGGGMSLVPHAIHNDGLLAVTLAGRLSKWSVLFNTYRFYNESLLKHSKIFGHQVKFLKLRSLNEQPLYLELDGEYVGQGPVEIDIIENALCFVI